MVEEADRENESASGLSWDDLSFLLLMIPLMVFLGAHLAGIAMLLRKFLRIPYLVSMLGIYVGLTVPLWLGSESHSVWIPTLATAAILVCVIGPIAMGGREEMMEGRNLEMSAPAHIMTILVYLLAPAIYAAEDAAREKRAKSIRQQREASEIVPIEHSRNGKACLGGVNRLRVDRGVFRG